MGKETQGQTTSRLGGESMARAGPKGKYRDWLTDEGLTKVRGWARDGLTNEQIAHNMGIGITTLYEWQAKFAEFTDALKKGKEVVDREVENALLKRAMGYTYDEVTQEAVTDPDTGAKTLKVTRRVTKEVAPDTTAQIFWLKNRKPQEWRDKQELQHEGDLSVIFNIPRPSDE